MAFILDESRSIDNRVARFALLIIFTFAVALLVGLFKDLSTFFG